MSDERIDEKTGLFLAKSIASTETDARRFRRETRDGRGRRIRRGVSMSVDHWAQLTPRQKYLVEIRAVIETRVQRPVVSHQSAAALWGLPVVGAWPASVHLLARPESHARSKNGVIAHREQFLVNDDVVEFDGMLVTSPARTVLDLARTANFTDAVVALDHALNPKRAAPWVLVSVDMLWSGLERTSSARGRAKATRAIRFAKPNADNAGESLSRVVIFELGFPDPVLQTRHNNPRGGYYYTDFEWPEFRVIGELDGRDKYLKEEYLRGRTPGQAVVEEKVREDHLRAEGNQFARWGTTDLRPRQSLFRILTNAGLPTIR